VYPNPAESGATLFFPSVTSKNIIISIIDATGKIIRTSSEKILPGNNKIDLGLQRLATGMYLVKVLDEGSESLISIFKKQR
jgi:Secretion system C-terminal sorting domain